MKIKFYINYSVDNAHKPRVFIEGLNPKGFVMRSVGGERWFVAVEVDANRVEYRYGVGKRMEYGVRRLRFGKGAQVVSVEDAWREEPQDAVLYSSPFGNVFQDSRPKKAVKGDISLMMEYPYLYKGQELVVVGGCKALGDWEPAKGRRMYCEDYPIWRADFNSGEVQVGVEYKFAIIDAQSGEVLAWEEGENRRWWREVNLGEKLISVESVFRGERKLWRGAGVAIPVFSLRSEHSAGIGDFADLGRFARWTAQVGGRVVQILPINDTTITRTYKDSYPYNSVSVYALHPLYLSMEKMGVLQDASLAHEIADRAQRLNELEQLDYEGVDELKWRFFRAMYVQEGEAVLESRDFKQFYNKNKHWLAPYALFCYLRDINGTPDYSTWGEWAVYDASKAGKMLSKKCGEYAEIALHLYLQYYLDKQLREARNEAAAVGVALKGDIPIGVSRHSVETWIEPQLFNLNSQAGAPPDDFSVKGQNWGFPTYNWAEMAKDGYAWWKKRFTKMYDYFELYRIDHILGFFRIWQIPLGSIEGLLGHFNPALPFSREELVERGLAMDEERFLRPHIARSLVKEWFGKNSWAEVRNEFFDIVWEGDYVTLKEEFDTQRKIEANLVATGREHLREALFSIVNDVLFVRDAVDVKRFHPRIAAHETFVYKNLMNDYERQRFNELYTDFYYHRHNAFWAENALRKLPVLINAAPMLCCAEDLGMIPDCVPQVLGALKVVTLEIERMPKNPHLQFGQTNHYPYLSVCTTSTHDMSPVRLWWSEMENCEKQQYYNHVMGWCGEAPARDNIDICRNILWRHLSSPAILSVIPLQDWFSICEQTRTEDIAKERINVPADPNHYWRYRMHLTIEEMETKEEFNQTVSNFIAGNDRI